MPDSNESASRARADMETIVCADSHVFYEPFDEVLTYIDGKYDGVTRIMEASQNPVAEVYSVVTATPNSPFQGGHEASIGDGNDETVRGKKLSQMDEFGIDASVLKPTQFVNLPTVNNPRFATAMANGYNSWVLDNYVDEDERINVAMLVAGQKPDRAAEEIDDRADEDGIVAVEMAASGLVPPPGHEWYEPIYQAAQDNDLAVSLHTGGGATHFTFPVQYKWNETFAEDHAMSHPFSLMWNLITMIFRGVPERYPDLDFVISEAGLGWIPYLMARLDDHYLEYSHEIPAINTLPTEYIKDQFYFTTQPLGHTTNLPGYVANVVEMIGPDSVLFSSDMPHMDFDPPDELYDRIRGSFEEEALRKIMFENAIDVFDLRTT